MESSGSALSLKELPYTQREEVLGKLRLLSPQFLRVWMRARVLSLILQVGGISTIFLFSGVLGGLGSLLCIMAFVLGVDFLIRNLMILPAAMKEQQKLTWLLSPEGAGDAPLRSLMVRTRFQMFAAYLLAIIPIYLFLRPYTGVLGILAILLVLGITIEIIFARVVIPAAVRKLALPPGVA